MISASRPKMIAAHSVKVRAVPPPPSNRRARSVVSLSSGSASALIERAACLATVRRCMFVRIADTPAS